MTSEEIRKDLESMIREKFLYEGECNLDTKVTDVDGWDSIESIDMVMKIEENFRITIPIGMIPKLNTVGEIINFISQEKQ